MPKWTTERNGDRVTIYNEAMPALVVDWEADGSVDELVADANARASAAKVVEAAEELLGELNKLKVTLSPLTPLWFERALSLHTLIAEWKGGPQ